jgi:hypothetical protein
MPSDWSEIGLTDQLRLLEVDRDLCLALGAGPMSSGMELALANNTFPAEKPAPASPEEVRAATVASLTAAGNPFMPGGSVTNRLLLEQVSPEAAAQQRQLAQPYIDQAAVNEATRRQQAEQARRQGAADHANYEAQAVARERFAAGLY